MEEITSILNNISPIWLIILPLLTAFSLGIAKLISIKLIKVLVVVSSTIHLGLAFGLVMKVMKEPIIYNLGSWDQLFAINLVIDPLGALLALLISGLSYLVIIYSWDYIYKAQLTYYVLLLLLIAGMIGMVLTGDLFNLYVFFEIVAITSYALVAFKKTDSAVEASFKYAIIGSIGAIFFLIGIIFTYQVTGTLNLAQIAAEMEQVSLGVKRTLLILFLFGLGPKFAVVPLHTWLPDAHPSAPAPVSALLSGVMIKTSLYAFVRISYLMFTIQEFSAVGLHNILIYGGVVTLLVGNILAYQQEDLKRLLAYSSVSQIGYLLIPFALTTEKGIIAGFTHLINHAVMKGALFLVAGIFVYSLQAHTIDELKGVGFSLPRISAVFTIAVLAIMGIPPLNGFISKWLIIEAAMEAGYFTAAFFVLFGSVLALSYYLKVIKSLYSTGEDIGIEQRPGWKLELPVLTLGCFCLVLGVAPQLSLTLIEQVPEFILDSSNYINIVLGG